MALEHVLEDARRRLVVHEVDRNRAHALLAERGGQSSQPLLPARDKNERCSRLAGETTRGGFSDPARRARDHRDERLAWGMCGVDDDVLALAGSSRCNARRSPVSLSDRRDHEREHTQRRRGRRSNRRQIGSTAVADGGQAPGAGAVPWSAATLRPAVGGAQLWTGSSMAARARRARWRRRRASGCSTWRPARGWSPPSCFHAATARSWASTRARRCSPRHERALRDEL